MSSKLIIAFLIASAFIANASPREWKNADASKSLLGDFVSRDEKSVTIRRKPDRKKFTIPFTQLHEDEVKWLNMNHPLPGQEIPKPGETFNPVEVYKALSFGDAMNPTIDKLEKCKHVKATMARTLFGRGGMNGVFKTVHKMGRLESSLYFGWDDDNKLKEISVRTSEYPATDYEGKLKPCWEECARLLTEHFGEPAGAAKTLELAPIPDKEISFTHLWKPQQGGSVLCGAGHENGKYVIIVRFTTDEH